MIHSKPCGRCESKGIQCVGKPTFACDGCKASNLKCIHSAHGKAKVRNEAGADPVTKPRGGRPKAQPWPTGTIVASPAPARATRNATSGVASTSRGTKRAHGSEKGKGVERDDPPVVLG